MADINVTAKLEVDDGAGEDRTFSVDDLKVAQTGGASETTLVAGLGTDGASPPSITGTGMRGWLRAIYERLVAGLSVTVTNPTDATDVSALATSAKQDTLHTDLAELLVLHADLAAVLAKESADPSTGANQTAANTKLDTLHTDIAAVLAKITSDPATQTTLAAVLAKLSADPATQTTLAALVAANHTDLAAILAKNEAIRALLASPLLVDSTAAAGFLSGDGRKTVTTAGTAVPLASSSTPCKWVSVQALPANTDKVTVGASTVIAASGTSRGNDLVAGDPPLVLPASNLNAVFVDARVNGEGVKFTYGT